MFITAPGKKSKWILEFLAYKLKLINAELIREHKRYYDKFEYEKLSSKGIGAFKYNNNIIDLPVYLNLKRKYKNI